MSGPRRPMFAETTSIGATVEFPGVLGIGLHRLRAFMRAVPIAALGPLLGIIAADMSLDIAGHRFGAVLLEIVIAPMVAMAVISTAQREHAGMSGLLLFVLGSVSAFGASVLLLRGVAAGSAGIVVMGVRHLTVCAYAWAAIATEPPRRDTRPAFVRA